MFSVRRIIGDDWADTTRSKWARERASLEIDYTAYGLPDAIVGLATDPWVDFDGDGDVDTNDFDQFLADYLAHYASGDRNNDAAWNFTDVQAYSADLSAANQTLTPTGRLNEEENPFGLDGYRYDGITGLYHVRHRALDPEQGKWMQRDPAGFVDGGNLYEYVGTSPMSHSDPQGLLKRKQVAEGDAVYSCGCGWIDTNHAKPLQARSLENQMRKGEASGPFVMPSRPRGGIDKGYLVTVGKGGGLSNSVQESLGYKGSLVAYVSRYHTDSLESIGLDIYLTYRETREWMQHGHLLDNYGQSGWSVEDPPSNLIGFYSAWKGYSWPQIQELCGTVDSIAKNLKIYDEITSSLGSFPRTPLQWNSGGNYYPPFYFHGVQQSKTAECHCTDGLVSSWPREFTTISRHRGYGDWFDWDENK